MVFGRDPLSVREVWSRPSSSNTWWSSTTMLPPVNNLSRASGFSMASELRPLPDLLRQSGRHVVAQVGFLDVLYEPLLFLACFGSSSGKMSGC